MEKKLSFHAAGELSKEQLSNAGNWSSPLPAGSTKRKDLFQVFQGRRDLRLSNILTTEVVYESTSETRLLL